MPSLDEKILRVYITGISDADISEPLVPPEREREVRAVRSQSLMREKYLAWKLLERAIKETFNMDISDACITRQESGMWTSPHFYLSLSHSRDALAVAVSTHPVGVDVEVTVQPRSSTFVDRVLTEDERAHYDALSDDERALYLTECWTRKESDFKRRGLSAFVPKNYAPDQREVLTRSFEIGAETYVLSVVSKIAEYAELIEEITL